MSAQVLDCSFIEFIYPFTFDEAEYDALTTRIESAVTAGAQTWDKRQFLQNDLLPHMASYLSDDGAGTPTVRQWELNHDNALQPYNGLGAKADWSLSFLKSDRSNSTDAVSRQIRFKFRKIHLLLFRHGVGMLSFRVDPLSTELAVWHDFIHGFRFSRRRGLGLRAMSGDESGTKQPWFPLCRCGEAGPVGSIGEIIAGLLLGIANARWWKDVFVPEQLIPYCGIFLEGQDPAEDPITIHRLRNFFHAEQDVHPSRNDLSFNHPFLLEYSDRHWFIFALNGGSFLGCNPPESPFFKETLPQHLSSQYFYLFLISLYQRFVLISLSERVAAHWVDEADEYERRVGFQRIRESFLTFTARGYFTQIMQQEHHHRNYRKWQEVFQINDLYAEVSGEIREMFEWLQLRLTERQAERMRAFERRATLFGIFFAVCVGLPSLVTSFLSMNIRDLPDTVDLNFRTAISIIGITVGFGLLIGAIVFLMMRDDLSPQASRQSPPNSGSSDTEARQKN